MTRPVLWTVGHSNHTIGEFIGMLRQYSIQTIADVRSSPRSRFAPQYNAAQLKVSLNSEGIEYVEMGQHLGGRPKDDAMYDSRGHALYGEMSRTKEFRSALTDLMALAAQSRTAVMCSEENPAACHRRLLVARAAMEDFAPPPEVLHLRAFSVVEQEEGWPADAQMPLFPGSRDWKSQKPIRKA